MNHQKYNKKSTCNNQNTNVKYLEKHKILKKMKPFHKESYFMKKRTVYFFLHLHLYLSVMILCCVRSLWNIYNNLIQLISSIK